MEKWNTKIKKSTHKQLIISKNNHRLSKEYSLIRRANRILKEIKFN